MKKSKKAGSPQKKLITTETSALKWLKVKENRIKFFRGYWKIYSWNTPYVYKPVEYAIPPMYPEDPQKAMEVMKCQRVLTQLYGATDYAEVMEVWDKYKHRIVRYVLKKVKANGGYFPTLAATPALWEFLRRGFVHKSEFTPDKGMYYIKAHIGDLVYPKNYSQHRYAIEELNKVGIPGLTGTIIPK